MRRELEKIKIGKFCNYYCDGLYCALTEFLDINIDNYEKIDKMLTLDEKQTLIDYAVCKNISAGVGKLNIKVSEFGIGLKSLEKYRLDGKEIVSAKNFNAMPTSSLIGERTMLDIENILDYNQNTLSDLSDFCARSDVPLAIEVASDLENVGKIVNMYKCSPVEVLESFGFLDRKCFVYGLNYIDKDDQKLLVDYDKICVLSPQDDGERGKGSINLFNFIYNHLKFGFSSGKCYNIDMLLEGKLARLNTFNLMHEGDIISSEDILKALSSNDDESLEIGLSSEERLTNLFDKRLQIEVDDLKGLREKTMQIARNIKEKI